MEPALWTKLLVCLLLATGMLVTVAGGFIGVYVDEQIREHVGHHY